MRPAKHIATPQAEYDAFSILPAGIEVWRGNKTEGAPAWPYVADQCYVKTSLMNDMLAQDWRTAPKQLGFMLFSAGKYCGTFPSLQSALNVGLGIAPAVAERIVQQVLVTRRSSDGEQV